MPAAIRAAAEYFGGEAPDMPDPQPSLIDFFKDVLSGSWFYKVIDYVTGKGYMRGMSADTFAPEGLVTRAQVAQILYNMEGKPSFLQSGSFSDTPRDEWFFTPVMWAESAGLVKGFPDGSYQPNAPVTREQRQRAQPLCRLHARLRLRAHGHAVGHHGRRPPRRRYRASEPDRHRHARRSCGDAHELRPV